jgi:hypothetical protein
VVNGARFLGAIFILGLLVVPAPAQQVAAEADLTGGYSAETIRAAASQVRIFGDAAAGITFLAEAAWGDRWAGDAPIIGDVPSESDPLGTDVFGAAYPYAGRFQIIEAYAERYFRPRGALFGVKGGRFRMPFGIYNRSDHGYSGFVRPPLIRYDGYWALSNNWLEDGVVVTGGLPQLFVEASVSRPHDIGSAKRREGTDASIRVQGFHGPLIVGVSHARSNPYMPRRFATGRQVFTGTDIRWSHSTGIVARSEVLYGRSFNGVSTTGWYIDGFLHRPGMGPFTALVRTEYLDYDAAPPRARAAGRTTVGTRVRWPRSVTVQLNFVRQYGDLPYIKKHSVDFSATYSVRFLAVPRQ